MNIPFRLPLLATLLVAAPVFVAAQSTTTKAPPAAGKQVTGPSQAVAEADAAAKKEAAPKAAAPTPPLPPPAQPKALYLTWQHDPTTTMTVQWHTVWTEAFSDSVLEYRAAGASAANEGWARVRGRAQPFPFTDRMVHTVELTQLKPDTVYEFRLGRLVSRVPDGELLFEPHGAVEKFRTLPATLTRPVKFVEGGDVYGGGVGNAEIFAMLCRIGSARDPDFAMLGGDIAYANDEPKAASRWFEFFRLWTENMRAPGGRLVPVVPAIGNHEVHGDSYEVRGGAPNRGMSTDRAMIFYSVFPFPGRPGYNVLDVGNYLSLVALDSFHTNPVPGPQTDWLQGVLAARPRVPYVVPFYHVPAYPSTRAFTGAVSVAIRANWIPLFDAAKVRFVFEHHDHTYKRTKPLRANAVDPSGTRYLGDGAWGVTKRQTHELEKATFLEQAEGRNHVFIVTLNSDRADFVAIDPAGEEFDRFTIPAKP